MSYYACMAFTGVLVIFGPLAFTATEPSPKLCSLDWLELEIPLSQLLGSLCSPYTWPFFCLLKTAVTYPCAYPSALSSLKQGLSLRVSTWRGVWQALLKGVLESQQITHMSNLTVYAFHIPPPVCVCLCVRARGCACGLNHGTKHTMSVLLLYPL